MSIAPIVGALKIMVLASVCHALRLGLALGFRYLLILLVPGVRHRNSILLTTAVIMRASYSVPGDATTTG